MLREESRAPEPHPCLAFSADRQLYGVVARAASATRDERVVRETVAVFSALVDSDGDEFVTSVPFARTVMRFVGRALDSNSNLVQNDTEGEIIELLFAIAAKIRLEPDILPVWFESTIKSDLDDGDVRDKRTFAGLSHKQDFPLVYILIDRIHHQGRIGDFARTGLLYVFEATSTSPDLDEWIVGSDLPTLMASGLGALYSQLSR